MIWKRVEQLISAKTGKLFCIDSKISIGGGCVNQAWKVSGNNQHYFVKTNVANLQPMFEAEAQSLNALQQSDLRVPNVIASGIEGSQSFLILEYIALNTRNGSSILFGEQLATMHKNTNPQFGFAIDNVIGATPQINTWAENWVHFYGQHRLGYQLRLAKQNGYGNLLGKGHLLIELLSQFFSNYQPQPALLHGDLWSGNYAFDEQGKAVIFDPATYYGDREADIAMTELFGGFSQSFYDAYNNTWALDAGYGVRKNLYNLYHIINHANLFGGSYVGQSDNMIRQLLSEVN